ncbi:MAG: dihydropteroate synthase [Candidatus Competibacteraceae bacterium]|uniref:Dihydropteroate synthase n=1 Tax=Candidatus Contendobacter odensis Run_B_J11 TaxID=1400861 RepID=A0A7U7G7R7_9GAMM|nr:dihydropteroate synthase [Candidatus Contendobacter odensis]MBK8537464.1 dihydropteroate synthase [Candidatus Competibacteraceae bacterium]CDH43497.1 7,8-dihydropteroate synthase [Candidatus Contendobacter odensis Run_B_J11]
MQIDCAGRVLDLSQPVVMGVLNVTPDSFSDGGLYSSLADALHRAELMVVEGAALIDVGGESTRPGAMPVSVQEEMDRVLPVVERLARELSVPISVDTSKPEVMRAAACAGAGLINDVRALRLPGALEAAVASGLPVCLMHLQGEPVTMQQEPYYTDVVADVYAFLAERVRACESLGIRRDRILVDPGFGFGKTLEHNLALLRSLHRFGDLAAGVLVGISRKSMIGALTGAPVGERLSGSLAAAVIAAWQGANIIRTHDVRETVHALCICAAARAIV